MQQQPQPQTLSAEQQDVENRLTKLSIRDAKGLSAELKETIKRRDINDRQLQLQVQTLRQAYLDLIFSPSLSQPNPAPAPSSGSPSLPPSKSTSSSSALTRRLELLNLLWLDTSHSIIQVFRAKVSTLNKAIAEAPRAHRSGSGGGGAGGGGRGGPSVPGPAARRKLIQAFRSFLSGEEDFFRALIGRLATGGLSQGDAEGLRALGVVVDLSVDPATGQEWTFSKEERKERRRRAVPLAHKALICFGDLARYKELYNEPGAAPVNPLAAAAAAGASGAKGGRNDSRGRRGGRGGGAQHSKSEPAERKVKNYTKAAECYAQARLLIPDNGNPSNQLAVLSQYAQDPLASTYHYYRALAVNQPFSTARTNLEIVYAKQLAKWIERDEDGFERDGEQRFRGAFVALQAVYFRAKVREARGVADQVESLFKKAVENRWLLSDTLAKVVVTALCSLWNARSLRTPPPPAASATDGKKPSAASSKAKPPVASPGSFAAIEPFVLLHVLGLFRVLLDAGTVETDELAAQNKANAPSAASSDENDNLAQNISAVLRRTLPAMRILSTWLEGQLEYIHRAQARVQAREQREGGPTSASAALGSIEFANAVTRFWQSYAAFGSAVQAAFPLDKLPKDEGVWLEEDVELLGFVALKKGMKELTDDEEGGLMGIARVGTEVHPNEEQLMRIAHIQRDAERIAASDLAPINATEDGLGFFCTASFIEEPSLPVPPPASALPPVQLRRSPVEERNPAPVPVPAAAGAGAVPTMLSDDGEEGSYQATEDDPVDLAMRVSAHDRMMMELDGGEEEDELDELDEEPYAMTSSGQLLNATGAQQLLPPPPATVSTGQGNNVADLLLQVLQGSPAPVAPNGGSPPIGGTGRSIWSPTEKHTPPAPITRDSFEALPNTTAHQAHHSPQFNAAQVWAAQGAQHQGTPSPLGYGAMHHHQHQQQTQHYGQQYAQPQPQQQQQHTHYHPQQQQQYSSYSQQPTAYSTPAQAHPHQHAPSSTSFFGGAFSPFSPQAAVQQLPPSAAPASWSFQPNMTAQQATAAAATYSEGAQAQAQVGGAPSWQQHPFVQSSTAHGQGYAYQGFG